MRYLIAGNGPAGVVAAEILRSRDPEGEIVLIGDEPYPPYGRMGIPYYLNGAIPQEGLWLRKDPRHFDRLGVSLLVDRVSGIEPVSRSLRLEKGGALSFDRLLLATGASPAFPPLPGIDLPGISPCWTLADAKAIAAHASRGKEVALIGAGFIGSILLSVLVERGCRITWIERETHVLSRTIAPAASDLIRTWCERKGVRIECPIGISGIVKKGDRFSIALDRNKEILADQVILATGVKPNVGFLAGSGLDIRRGIRIDERMESSEPGIYAAGDVAEALDRRSGEYNVLAIQPVAVEQGRIAAINMSGGTACHHGSLSMNVLDTLGLLSASFGANRGVRDGDSVIQIDSERFRYLHLEFAEDRLIGASTVGFSEQIGCLNGLIQGRFRLGAWYSRLVADPSRYPEAFAALSGGSGYPFAKNALFDGSPLS